MGFAAATGRYASIKNLCGKISARCLDFVYPPLCIVCNELRIDGSNWLCESCIQSLIDNHTGRTPPCPTCGTAKHSSCLLENRAVSVGRDIDRIWSFVDYQNDVAASAVRRFKFGGAKKLAYDLGAIAGRFLPQELIDSIDVIVPVPLHWMRRLKRGYNQADQFARGLHVSAWQQNCEYRSVVLRRIRHTKMQARLDKENRAINVSHAFSVDKKHAVPVAGKNILVVDDVVTTRATVAACATALKDAGARSVSVVSFARD